MFFRINYRFLFLPAALVAIVTGAVIVGASAPDQGRITVTGIESLGIVTFPTGYRFAGTEVGGLSGIAYDAYRDVYYVISDADAPRFYTVDIDVSDGTLDPGDVVFQDVTFLRNHTNTLYTGDTVDAESMVVVQPGTFYISAEGQLEEEPFAPPFVDRFNPTGKQTRALPIDEKFLPGGSNSVRENLAFESLTVDPAGEFLYTAIENALEADGPVATVDVGSPARVVQFSLAPAGAGAEYVYPVGPIPFPPNPPGAFADNGLVELQALDDEGSFIAMERSFAVGVGNTVRLFETTTTGATDVSSRDHLGMPGSYEPMDKRLLADFEVDLGVDPDNLEALRFGPTLPDGRQLLIVVSDNNFNPGQITQFVALAVALAPVD